MDSPNGTPTVDAPVAPPRSPLSTVTITSNRETGQLQSTIHNANPVEVLRILHSMVLEVELKMAKELVQLTAALKSITSPDAEE